MKKTTVPSRREFFYQMLHGFASVSALQILDLRRVFAAPAQYDYFVAVMPHSLALLKTENDVSLHGDFFQGYGNWRFNGYGTLSGLDSIKSNIFIPRGLTYSMQPGTEGVGHFQAQGAFLTGYPSRGATTIDMLVGSNTSTPAPASVQSIDWMIAKKAGLQPLAVGYRNRPAFNEAESPTFFRAISWRDPSTAFYPAFDSAALLEQLKTRASCSSFTSDPVQIQAKIDQGIQRDKLIRRAQKNYGVFYKNNRSHGSAFERYLDDFSVEIQSIARDRELLEAQKVQALSKPALCDLPVPQYSSAVPSFSDRSVYEGKIRELNTMVARAFKAGLTNAATFSVVLEENHGFQHYISNIDIGREGFTREQILGHGQGLRNYMDSVTKCLVHLVDQLKAQGIFERTLILFGGEQNDGNAHVAREAPVVVIDGKSGAWNGRILGTEAPGRTFPETRPYSDLLVDILRKFGFDVAEFGSPMNVKGVGRGGLF